MSGKVLDSLTSEGVQFANVYFANTSIGTVTDSEGKFMFSGFPPGKYDLTVSFVGYQTWSSTVEFDGTNKDEVLIKLKPEVRQLSEVYIRAGNENWEKNFKVFQNYFLGLNEAASMCSIMNPESIYFFHDPEDNNLYATASEPVTIKNEYLGYNIYFDLSQFRFDYDASVVMYYGIPRYEPMEPKNQREMDFWLKNRLESYKGSMIHFFRSVYNRRLMEEQFQVQMLFKKPNTAKLPVELINERLERLNTQRELPRKERVDKMRTSTIVDSIKYYLRMRRMPDVLDSLSSPFDLSQLLNSEGRLNYRGYLQVKYFRSAIVIDNDGVDTSTILFRQPVWVYANGYYDDIRSVYIEGKWAISDAMANLVPLDYKPPDE